MSKQSRFDADAVLRTYFADARAKLFQKGELIIEGQSPPNKIYMVESGFVKGYSITHEGSYNLIIIKSGGDLMPLASLFDGEESQLYYEAITDVLVRPAPKDRLEKDMLNDHQLALAVAKKSLQLLRDYSSRLHNLEIADARRRIIYRLLFLSRRFGAASKKGHHVIFAPVNHQDLADAINLTRETANRVVRQLVDEGVVLKRRDHLTIVDLTKLSAEVEGL